MFDHILFPTDDSAHAQKALAQLKDIARAYGSKVTVLHTFELSKLTSIQPHMNINYHFITELSIELKDKSRTMLEKVKKELTSEGISVALLYKEGSAEQTICEVAEDLNCDLIVMGIRGLGSIKEFLIGSVSQYVVHHSSCPVLLIP